MTVHLYGSVPVTVVYDEDELKVTRVIVHDDAHEWGAPGTANRLVERPGSYGPDYDQLDAEDEADLQSKVGLLEWPAWEFGW